MIYFDNAATSGKKPKNVIKEVNNALLYYNANSGRSGHTLAVRTAEKIYEVREKTAAFFNASGAEKVIFTLNCTHAINYVIKGVLQKGDHIIISSLEHNSVLRPVVKSGAEYSIAKVDFESDDETVENFRRLIRSNTKMVFCTGASNVTGKLLPIKEIGCLCREHKILFGVDAAQLAGIKKIDMKEMNIDFLCVAPHKGLYAPTGIGILIAESYIENTLLEGGTGGNSAELYQPEASPERYESGTVNIPGILGVGAGIDFLNEVGINRLYSHENGLIINLYTQLLKNPRIIVYSNPIAQESAPVIAFNFRNIYSEAVALELSKKGIATRAGLHCAPLAHKELNTSPTGAVRLSVGWFNTQQEVAYFNNTIKDVNFLKNLEKRY